MPSVGRGREREGERGREREGEREVGRGREGREGGGDFRGREISEGEKF